MVVSQRTNCLASRRDSSVNYSVNSIVMRAILCNTDRLSVLCRPSVGHLLHCSMVDKVTSFGSFECRSAIFGAVDGIFDARVLLLRCYERFFEPAAMRQRNCGHV